jgi:hypothetical protein
MLYQTGIVQGSGETHACNPDSYIKRGEVAAILTRMTDEAMRIEFSIDPVQISEADEPPALSGPTEEIDWYGASMRYRTDLFDLDDDAGIYPLTAKDGSVSIAWSIVRDLDGYRDAIDEILGYDAEGLVVQLLDIAGFDAFRTTHYDDMFGHISLVFIDFLNTEGDGPYGVRIECASEDSIMDTWTTDIQAMLETICVDT